MHKVIEPVDPKELTVARIRAIVTAFNAQFEANGGYKGHDVQCHEVLLQRISELEEDVAELQHNFDLRWKADMRAIKRWQGAHPGNDLKWPDHADMVVWLLERAEGVDLGTTHSEGCYLWGPKHHGCAIAKIMQLQADLAKSTPVMAVTPVRVVTMNTPGVARVFKTTVLGVGPFCVECADGEVIHTRSEERARLIAAALKESP